MVHEIDQYFEGVDSVIEESLVLLSRMILLLVLLTIQTTVLVMMKAVNLRASPLVALSLAFINPIGPIHICVCVCRRARVTWMSTTLIFA